MTATLSPVRTDHEVTPRLPGMKVTQARVIRSEWTKFRSLRSMNLNLAISVVLTIGLGALITALTAANWSKASASVRAGFDPVSSSLSGVGIAQLAIGVLGVLLISGEYSTGMIRASLTAVPQRLPVLWAKVIVFAGVVGSVSVVSTFIAFFLGQSLLSSQHLQVSITSPHAVWMVLGSAAYLVMIGLIGLALGGLLRNTAAAISSLVALLFVIPPLLDLLPSGLADHIGPYLPSSAGDAVWAHPTGTHLSAMAGFLVLCLWAAAAIGATAINLKRRDA